MRMFRVLMYSREVLYYFNCGRASRSRVSCSEAYTIQYQSNPQIITCSRKILQNHNRILCDSLRNITRFLEHGVIQNCPLQKFYRVNIQNRENLIKTLSRHTLFSILNIYIIAVTRVLDRFVHVMYNILFQEILN